MQPLRCQGARGTTRPTPPGTAADSLSDGQRARLIGIACRSPADFGVPHTHWSRKTLRDALLRQRGFPCISPRTVGRELDRADLQPHRQRMWLNSHDPRYDQKLADVVALYTDPPRGATVLCFDEKTSIQALERKHPDLPMRPGHPVCREFEYVRHGVTHLLAALDVKTGAVVGGFCQKRGRTEFVHFMQLLAAEHPRGPVHVILDNLNTHSGPAVAAWLRRHSRFVFHFTPFHASWLNQIENWFGRLTDKVLRRGSFTSVPDLQGRIRDYIRYHNVHDAQPIHWTYEGPAIAEAA